MSDLNLQPDCEQIREPGAGEGSTFPRDRVRLQRRFGDPISLMIIDELDAFSQPFIHEANAAYVGRAYEVIRQVRRSGCHLVPWEVDTSHLKNNPIVGFLKRISTSFPAYKCAGTTALVVFER